MWQIIKNLEPSLTPVCIFWCAFKPCICKKLFPHKEHECGFSFEWTFRWPFRLEAHKHFKVYVFLLGQIYTEDILLLDALLCHVWWGRGVRAGKYCEYFSYAWVDYINECNSSRMQCSDTVSLQCESSRVISGFLTDWISCRSVNTCKVSLQCGSSHVFSGFLTDWISCRSVNTCKVSLQCESSRAVSIL